MKKELYVSPEIKVLSFHFEAIVCVGSPQDTGFGDGGEIGDGGDL